MTVVLLMQLAIKASLVLAATAAVAASMRRGSAAARHLVWTLGVAATFMLPLVRVVGPTWTIAVPESTWLAAAVVPPAAARMPPAPEDALLPAQAARNREPAAADVAGCAGAPCAGAPVRATDMATASNAPGTLTPVSRGAWFVLIWFAGVGVLLGRLAYALVRARGLARRAEPVTHVRWLAAFDHAAAAMRIDRPVGFRQSDELSVPVACGLWRSTVLLPRDADSWDEERRMVVLLHELAHVRRRDCLVQTLAQATCALHWVNPLAHLALRRIRAEQERACDDLVLAAGTEAPDYADHLFEIARSFRPASAHAWATLAMARPSQLEGRLMAILDDRCHRAPLARRARISATAAAVMAIVGLGALHVTATTPSIAAGVSGGAPTAAASTLPSTDAATPVALAFRVFEQVTSRAAAHPGAHQRSVFTSDAAPHSDPDPDATPGDSALESTPGFLAASFTMANAMQQPAPPATQPSPVTDETRRRVADALATALNDENEEVRGQALNSLAAMRDARAVPALLKALRDPSVRLRQRAVNGLAQFDTPEALDGLMSALKDANPDVREQAARSVGGRMRSSQLQDPKYTDAFLALLKDQVPDVREQAIMLLGRMRARQAVPSLLPLLKDPAVDVRERAAMALGMIGDPAAIDPLTAALKDADAGVREQAAIALGQIARGQRRDGPGFVPPIPPIPPLPPRRPIVQLDLDREQITEMTRRAREESAAALERSLADLDKTITKGLDKAFEQSGKR